MCAWAAFFCYCYFGCMPKKGPMLEDSSLWPGTLMKNVSFFSLLSAHVTMLPSEPAFPYFHSVLNYPQKSHSVHVLTHFINTCNQGHLIDVEFCQEIWKIWFVHLKLNETIFGYFSNTVFDVLLPIFWYFKEQFFILQYNLLSIFTVTRKCSM